MRGISSYDSSSISTLFSSMNSSSSGSNFLGINLQDYANIKSGAYGKLMKSYYKMQTGDTKTSSKDKANSSTSTSKDSSKILANVESAAEELTATAKDLYSTKSNSVFSKKDGNYDSKKISDKLNSFVEDYNDLLTSSAKSTASCIESSIESLKTVTADKSKDLEDIGISVDSKTGILSFDSGKFNNADMDQVKKLFNGTGSYAYSVATRASLIDSYAQSEATKSNTYGKNGKYSYNYNSGDLFYDSF